MNNKNIAFFVHSILALVLAIQIWVWLRYAGVFWLSDSLGIMKYLVKSVSPLKSSLNALLVLVVPVIVVSFGVRNLMSTGMIIAFYSLLGSLYSLLSLIIMTKMNLAFIWRHMWVYLAAGSVGGLTYGTVLYLPWKSCPSSGNKGSVLQMRRRLLGSLGMLGGMTGLLGVLSGPFYLWKSRNKYIDVNVGPLQEDQLLTLLIASKPVYILKRSPEVIRLLEQDNPGLLDPQSEFSRQPEAARNALRSIRPEFFVAYGICTHLGCSPEYRPNCGTSGDPCQIPGPQFFCPCHSGVFDLAGRVYRGTPPPENLVVPKYEFVSQDVVRLHFPSLAEEWNA